jgi:hypothetical protein
MLGGGPLDGGPPSYSRTLPLVGGGPPQPPPGTLHAPSTGPARGPRLLVPRRITRRGGWSNPSGDRSHLGGARRATLRDLLFFGALGSPLTHGYQAPEGGVYIQADKQKPVVGLLLREKGQFEVGGDEAPPAPVAVPHFALPFLLPAVGR